MASLNYSICLSSPPISVYSYDGLSSTYIDLTLESYSAGSFSSKMYESLLTPTSSPGLSNELSTRPGIGKKTVFLVLVLTTTHFSSGFSSGSTSSSSSGSISRISTTLLTNQGNCLFCLILFLLSWSSYWTLVELKNYFFHVGIDFVHLNLELLDVIVEHTNTILDLFVCQVGQLGRNFVEVGTDYRLCHEDFKFFLNFISSLKQYYSKPFMNFYIINYSSYLIGHGTFTIRNPTEHRKT